MFNVSMYEIAQMTKDELDIFIRLIKRDRNEIRKNITKQMEETKDLLQGLDIRRRHYPQDTEIENSFQEMTYHHNMLDRILDAFGGPVELPPRRRFGHGKARARAILRSVPE